MLRLRPRLALGLGALVTVVFVSGSPPVSARPIVGASISGVVVDAAGQPVEHAQIVLHQPSPPGTTFFQSAIADSNGRYTLDRIFPGTYTVSFSGPESSIWWRQSQFQTGSRSLSLSAGEQANHVDAVLPAAGHLMGTVTAADTGVPLAGVGVEVDPATYDINEPQARGVTDSAGHYDVAVRGGQRYEVFFDSVSGYPSGVTQPNPPSVSIGAGKTVVRDFQREPAAELTGRLVYADDGAPAADLQLLIGPDRGARTDASGVFRASNLVPGTDTVTYDGPDVVGGSLGGVPLPPGETTDLGELLVTRSGTVSGTITDTAGQPVPGGQVGVAPVDHPRDVLRPEIADADADGHYVVTDVPPGRYVVVFASPGGFTSIPERYPYAEEWFPEQEQPSSASVVTAAPGTAVTGVDAQLEPSGEMYGTVTDARGQPVAGVQVAARPLGAGPYGNTSVTDAEGVFRMSLSSGQYTVEATYTQDGSAPTYAPGTPWSSDAGQVTVADGGHTRVDIPLLPGATISGRIRSSDGDAAMRYLSAFPLGHTDDPGPVEVDMQLGADGAYTLPALRPGTWRVRSTCDGQDDRFSTTWFTVTLSTGQHVLHDVVIPDDEPDACDPRILPARTLGVYGVPRVGHVVGVPPWPADRRTLVTYTWWAGERRIKTGPSHRVRLGRATRGRPVRVVVTLHRPGYPALRIRSPRTAAVR